MVRFMCAGSSIINYGVGSQQPSCKKYGIVPGCCGGRQLSHEMWSWLRKGILMMMMMMGLSRHLSFYWERENGVTTYWI